MTNPYDEHGLRAGGGQRFAAPADLGNEPSPQVGWKLAFGAPAALAALGLDAPLIGPLTRATELVDAQTVDVAGFTAALAEPELVIFLGSDVPATASRAQAAAAVAGLAAGIELIDLNRPLEDAEALLADGLFHRGWLIGERQGAPRAHEEPGWRLRAVLNGDEIRSASAADLAIDDPIDLVLGAARTLEARGRALRAGAFVMSGSVVPPIPVAPGDRLDIDFSTLGRLRLRFADGPTDR